MEVLGNDYEGILVIPVEKMLLPSCTRRAIFSSSLFPEEDVKLMMENPTDDFTAVITYSATITDENVYSLGVVCKFKFIRLEGEGIELNVIGCARVEVNTMEMMNGFHIATKITEIKCENSDPNRVRMLMDEIQAEVDKLDSEMAGVLKRQLYPSKFADMVLDQFITRGADLARVVEITSVLIRMKEAHKHMMEASKSLTEPQSEIEALQAKYDSLTLPKKAKDEIGSALRTLSKMHASASEYPANLRYVEFALSLPWEERTTDNEIGYVEEELEKSHYGMEKAKERLIEYLAIKKLNPDTSSMTVLLDGAPGTGKTTLALSLGKAMGRKVERLSLGGCADPSFFKGHSRTYTGSRYGRIMQAMQSAGVKNPIIVLDEVEKVTDGIQGSATATLLEILDPKTNKEFTDAYLGFDFDLSEVIFIATSNERDRISPPVYDRMEYIACDGYTQAEKIKIATQYTIPAVSKDLGVPEATISKSVLKYLIEGYTFEAGVRTLEKAIKSCLRKVAVEKSKGKDVKVTKKLVVKRLGKRYEEEVPMKHTVPGIVSGMYYSSNGGGVLDIEAIITEQNGTGRLDITGQCGDVMLESIRLVKAHMTNHDYGINGYDLNDWDMHLHMPAGATPKDGPSAGGAYALLFASLLMNRPVKEGLCLTGECNLHGHITPIGGVDQKCAGAVRLGFTDVCLPKGNKRDWDELPKHVKEGATYHFVETVGELLDIAFDYSDIEEDEETKEMTEFYAAF